MKIIRSTKCSLKFATKSKLKNLYSILKVYGETVNVFIDLFWQNPISKSKILKDILQPVKKPISERLKKVAAREALDMISAAKEAAKATNKTAVKPTHYGNSMSCSSTIADLIEAKNAKNFDCWFHLQSLGNKLIIDLPIKLHKHYLNLLKEGKRLNSYIIHKKYVQFCFEIETQSKKEIKKAIGIDSGINTLITTSTYNQYGKSIKTTLEVIKRCKYGSNRQKSLRNNLRQKIDETLKLFLKTENPDLIVFEDLSGITKNTNKGLKRGPKIRFFVGSWNIGYYFNRLKQLCESNRVAYRTVSAYNTSRMCSCCGYTDKRNRNNEIFRCLRCSYTQQADKNAAYNILVRYLSGPYGAGCKEKMFQDMVKYFDI